MIVLASSTLLAVLFGGSQVAAQSPSQAQLRLLQSTVGGVTLELASPSYEKYSLKVEGQPYVALSAQGLGRIAKEGAPQLPTRGTMIALPPGAEATLKVTAEDVIRETLTAPVVPAVTEQVQLDLAQPRAFPSTRELVRPDQAIYSARGLYPRELAWIEKVGNWRSQRYALIQLSPFQFEPATRQLVWNRKLHVEITFRYPGAQTPAPSASPAVDEGSFEPILKTAFLNYDSAKTWRNRAQPSVKLPRSTALNPPASSGPSFKLAVNADGIYQITCAQLQSAGASPLPDPRTIKVYKNGAELAIDVIGQTDGVCDPSDYVLFYGEGIHTQYTDTSIYWLTYGGTNGKRATTRDVGGAGTPSGYFVHSQYLEQNRLYFSYIPFTYYPRVEGADHWYWDRFYNPSYRDFSFPVDYLDPTVTTATLRVDLTAYDSAGHHTLAYVNGSQVADQTWSGAGYYSMTVSFPATSTLQVGINTLRISEPNNSGVTDLVYMNHFQVWAARPYTATGNALLFGQDTAGTWQYQVTGFANNAVDAFDVTDPQNIVRLVNGTTAPQGAGLYSFQFADAVAGSTNYTTVSSAGRLAPVSITLDTPSNLQNPSNGADYIVITPSAFRNAIQPLVAWRQSKGLRTMVVDVQDVYDEFSDGLMDAQAIHDFLAYAYGNFQAPAPAYVLLVGDGTYDFKNAEGTSDKIWIPPYLRSVDPYIAETASDNQLVAFDVNSNLPSMMIGRLPANSAAEVTVMVNKVLANEQNPPPGAWRTTITFVSDNTYKADGSMDTAGDFWALSDKVASDPSLIPSPYVADRVYFNPCPTSFPNCALPNPAYPPYTTDAAVRAAVTNAVNSGRLIVNYVGHSAIQYWAHESLYRLADVQSQTNTVYPVFLDFTCYDGYFTFPGYPSLGEANVRQFPGGALASWSPTGLGVATGHDFLDRGFFDYIMNRGSGIGSATVAGKVYIYNNAGGADRDLIDTFLLFGDPAGTMVGRVPTAVGLSTLTAEDQPDWNWTWLVVGLAASGFAGLALARRRN